MKLTSTSDRSGNWQNSSGEINGQGNVRGLASLPIQRERALMTSSACLACRGWQWSLICVSCALVLSVSGRDSGVQAAEDDADFFEARVRPVLLKHCVECHGEKKQESGLRLDHREGWQTGGDSGPAVVSKKPQDSLLLRAVRYDDADLQMPPERKLSQVEIADLTEWIRRGAFDPRTRDSLVSQAASVGAMTLAEARDFWAFQPPERPDSPAVDEPGWVRTPIDAFVLAKLNQQGLRPVGDADRRTLIRRASFDLTGLPPTPEETAAFVNDDSAGAFATLVERLLESPAYGERWGRHWLDVARYADTAGDGADYPVREAVKYRDWVIRSFNNDRPYDEFVREQIAGDILARSKPADQYSDLVTATGFLAIGKRYGYKPSPDYQHLDFADVIDSVGRSLLGQSLGCARCHDHKYDPISARDYYALYGILQSTKWAFPGGEEQKRPSDFSPLVPPDEAARRDREKAAELAKLDARIAERKREQSGLKGELFAGGRDLDFESQKTGAAPGKPWLQAGPGEVTAAAQSPFQHVHPQGDRGVRIGSGRPTDGLRYVFEQGLRAASGRKMHFTIDFRTVAGSQVGAFRFYLGRGVVQSLAVECSATATSFAIRNGTEWETVRELIPGTWYTLRLTIDPDSKTYSGIIATGKDDLTEFENRAVGPAWDGVIDTFICDAFGHVSGPACARELDNLGLQQSPFGAPGSGPIQRNKQTPDMSERLGEIEQQLKQLTGQREAVAVTPAYEVAYGVSEGTPVNAKVQQRGEPHRQGEEVPRRFIEVLGGDALPDGETGSGRLQLAQWLTAESNPLTARVFVNRVWQWHFGRGLVATASNFGSRGERPSHPELLDWLTTEFIASGWSVKSLHRLIMNSHTWQLSSDDSPNELANDPGNRWYWRHSRRPLDAESIRDAMLTVSGRLDTSPSQPHPFPPVNTWGFTIHRPFHAVYDSNHRSMYLMVQRNRRHPYLALFDSADPNQSVASRQPTITPTQALYLMNSLFVHQQADGLARRLLTEAADPSARTRLAFEIAHGRVPADEHVDAALDFVAGYRTRLASGGDVSEHEHAAWSALARVLLTSNAFLYVD